MFVECTPNKELSRRSIYMLCFVMLFFFIYTDSFLRILKDNSLKIKVVEKPWKSIMPQLDRIQPFSSIQCGSYNCNVCKINASIACEKRNVVYQLRCNKKPV